MNYRKIWKDANGPIPADVTGRPHEIHHIDGDRSNNDISNLLCVSINEHYKIHEDQGDYGACLIMAGRMNLSYEDTCIIARKQDRSGNRNPSWGKRASPETRLEMSERVKKVWESRDEDYRENFGNKISETRKQRGSGVGEKNSMYGRSAVTENRLRWYNNGESSMYVTEGTQPPGYIPGRGKIKW